MENASELKGGPKCITIHHSLPWTIKGAYVDVQQCVPEILVFGKNTILVFRKTRFWFFAKHDFGFLQNTILVFAETRFSIPKSRKTSDLTVWPPD